MKKVLILTVIAIMALGVFALANETLSTGATCSTAKLTVESNIYVVPGYVATATAYDATFCGASGYLMDGTVLINDYSGITKGNYETPNASGVALAMLQMKSNHQTIEVSAVVSVLDGSNNDVTNDFPYNGNGLLYTPGSGASYDSGSNVWTLPAGSSPYEGTAYLYYGSGMQITPWIEAGKYTLHVVFTITPATLNGDGNFNF